MLDFLKDVMYNVVYITFLLLFPFSSFFVCTRASVCILSYNSVFFLDDYVLQTSIVFCTMYTQARNHALTARSIQCILRPFFYGVCYDSTIFKPVLDAINVHMYEKRHISSSSVFNRWFI